MYREFETGDSKDVDYKKGGRKAVHAAYHVYFGAESVIKGWADFDYFSIPQSAHALAASLSIAMAVALF